MAYTNETEDACSELTVIELIRELNHLCSRAVIEGHIEKAQEIGEMIESLMKILSYVGALLDG